MLDRDQLRRNLTQTVIGRPLLDFISDPVNINQPYDVIIDPNLDFAGGRELAAEQIKKLIQTAAQSVGRPTDPDPAIRYSADHPYIFATLPARVII